MRQINLRVPEELLARIDAASGDVPRERWLRRAVEQALGSEAAPEVHSRDAVRRGRDLRPSTGSSPAPAEQPLNRADLFRRATQR